MTDMLERVARALCAIECRSMQGSCMECFEACRREFDDDARAVVRAVFEGQPVLAAGGGVGGMTLEEYYWIDKAEVDQAIGERDGADRDPTA